MSLNLPVGPFTSSPTGAGPLGSAGIGASGLGLPSLPGMDDSSSSSFGDVLKNAVNQVSGLQDSADTQVNTLMQGGSSDLSKVMVSVEKADVAFQLMLQVRNKIVTAYQDIEKMQF